MYKSKDLGIERILRKIPKEKLTQVIEIIQTHFKSVRIPEHELQILFEVYNEFIGIDRQEIDCSYCRIKVVGTFKRIYINLDDEQTS